ncbi:hypothetical protein [Halococcus sp. AFM35]|uniref:Ig-like domain-containing protein n=1 Tax=Halococcus sp. AFM35 TaxID=3421653 RepID=UPI003EBAA9BD
MDDERAVSPVVGFVLMFALVMIVFTLYQSSVVPAQNEEVEFKHSQTVEGQMSKLSGAIQSASADGASRSQTVAIGMNYPTRALAINPGSPAGTLRTSKSHTINITGVNVKGSKYWDGSDNSNDFKTRSLSYAINYNVLQSSPKFTIANGVVSKSYDSGTLAVGDSTAVLPGTQHQIDLTLLGGDYQKNGLTANPTVKPISTSTQYLDFTAKDSTEIELGTSLSESECKDKWSDLIGEDYNEIDGSSDGDNKDDNSPNSAIDCSGGDPIMTLEKDEDYTLRISKIGFGDTSGLSSAADAHEVIPTENTDEDPSDSDPRMDDTTAELSATPGKKKSFTVLVRDKYGNPVSDATVSTDNSGTDVASGTVEDSSTTNDQGKVNFTYTPKSGASGTKTIVVSLPKAGSNLKATYKFNVADDNSDNSDDIGGDIDNGYALPDSRRVTIDSATAKGSNSVEFEFINRGDVDMTITEIQFHGYVGHFPSSDFATTGTFGDTAVELNGETVTLNSPVSIENRTTTDDTTTATLSGLDVNNVKTGLLTTSVKYEYTVDGETKTDTATYSVPVLS